MMSATPVQVPKYTRVVGLNLHHFTARQVIGSFLCTIACFCISYAAHYTVWKRTSNPRIRTWSTLVVMFLWGTAWYLLQPRNPYWINEFAVMAYFLSSWHLIDWLVYRLHEVIPPHVRLHHLLLDDALVMRPFLLRHKLGQKLPTGRSWRQRLRDASPYLRALVLQYCGCEALNAWLMRQSVDDVLHGPLLYRLAATFAFGMTLYYHLGYFYNLVACLSVLAMDALPEDWPPAFHKPWAAASPTEFWNERWHSMFKHWFTRLVFKPTRALMLRALSDPSYLAAVNVTVVAASTPQPTSCDADGATAASLTPLTASTSTAFLSPEGAAAAAANASVFKSMAGLRRRRRGKVPSDSSSDVPESLIATAAQDGAAPASSPEALAAHGSAARADMQAEVATDARLLHNGSPGTQVVGGVVEGSGSDEVVAGWVPDTDNSSSSSSLSSSEADLSVEVQAMEALRKAAGTAAAQEEVHSPSGSPAAATPTSPSPAATPLRSPTPEPPSADEAAAPAAGDAAAEAAAGAAPAALAAAAGTAAAASDKAASGASAQPQAAAGAAPGGVVGPVAPAKLRGYRRLLLQVVPVMAVFVWSGVFHEILLQVFFGAATGEQLLFFVIHGVACLVHRMWRGDERPAQPLSAQQQQGQQTQAAAQPVRHSRQRKPMPRWLGVLLFNVFMVFSALALFIRPWFRFSYHRELRVPVPGPVNWAVNWALDALSL